MERRLYDFIPISDLKDMLYKTVLQSPPMIMEQN